VAAVVEASHRIEINLIVYLAFKLPFVHVPHDEILIKI
jgi:hypothetical protein